MHFQKIVVPETYTTNALNFEMTTNVMPFTYLRYCVNLKAKLVATYIRIKYNSGAQKSR